MFLLPSSWKIPFYGLEMEERQEMKITVTEEHLHIDKEVADTGSVRVSKKSR